MPGSGVGRVAGLVLAAGAGRRYGRPKAFEEVRGELMVERAARGLLEAGCRPVYAVVGAGAHRWRAPAGVVALLNEQWAEGIGSSLRHGLAAARGGGASAVLVTLADLPGVGAAAHRRVLGRRGGAEALVATYEGRRGHPVLLEARSCDELARTATGDSGARGWLSANPGSVMEVDCSDVGSVDDIDTPADLERWLGRH